MALGNEVNDNNSTRNGPNKVKKQNSETSSNINSDSGKKAEKRRPNAGIEGGGTDGAGSIAGQLNGHSYGPAAVIAAPTSLKLPSYAAAARSNKEHLTMNDQIGMTSTPEINKDSEDFPKEHAICPMNNNNLTSISKITSVKTNGSVSGSESEDTISIIERNTYYNKKETDISIEECDNNSNTKNNTISSTIVRTVKENEDTSAKCERSSKCQSDNKNSFVKLDSVVLVNGNLNSDSKTEEVNNCEELPIVNGHSEKDETKTEDAEDENEKKNEQEVVFIQDLGFTVKIICPGAEPFDIQVSSMELVQEIHQLLMDREDTCHRTCFSLQLDGVTLDNFAELKNVEGLKEASIIKIVEEPYTVREARIHVRHVRDLLKSLDSSDAYNGVECNSLAFLNVVTQGDIIEKKKTRPESVDCTPPDHIMPGSKDRPLLPLHPSIAKDKDNKGPQCLKVLTTSGWNPPPGPRKMNGDLLYLYVSTMEDKHFHITACPRGFYLNQCSEETFDPRPDAPSHLCHSLIELLSIISPIFKRSFINVQKRKTQKHPFERVATPYQLYQWVSPVLDHTIDAIRAEDTFSSKLGYEEHIPGQTRDWNEELQTTRELPRKTLPERLLRERAIFKVHSDFVTAATRGAMAVVDGNVMAINPGEDAKMQMFIWNNIFFSLGFDVRDHYKELGGDAAAFIAPRNDLQGVRVYNAVDLEGLYTLGTVVVDYRGFRVTAQSIIPGILEKEQEQSVIYGSIDFGKTVLTHPKYMELLSKAGQQLKILPHSVMSAKGDSVELCSSVECKGIVGNDGRYYILDLLRTFPPDVNFLKLDNDDLRDDIKAMGFPIIHKHKLCCLRQELVDSFVEARYFMFIRYAAFNLQQLGAKKQGDKDKDLIPSEPTKDTEEKQENGPKAIKDVEVKEKSRKELKREKARAEAIKDEIKEEAKKVLTNGKSESNSDDIQLVLDANDAEIDADEAKKIVESITDSMTNGDNKQEFAESTRSIVMAAAKAVGSLKTTEFDVRFNPDVYSEGIEHAGTAEELTKQRHLVKEAAAFLLTTQIPAFVRECLEHGAAPLDGAALVEALHARGVNARYLGRVAMALAQHPPLSYLHTIAVGELITRAAKHIFTVYLQSLDAMCLAPAASHFLNCLLGACPSPQAGAGWEPMVSTRGSGRSRRAGGRRAPRAPALAPAPNAWTALTPRSLTNQIRNELKSYWGFDLQTTNMESTIEKYGLQKISLLRSFCLKVGLQILLREYDFENKNKPPFGSSDITNIFPVVKHINPRASDAYNFYTTGQSKIQAGQIRDGHELITEALNLLNNVYGAMHPEIAQCLRMVARLCYVAGEHRDAMAYQQKAVLMSERVNGVDHPYTITEYTHLALYCFANSQVTTALKLLYRARYLALIVCGENHPEIALLDSNISLILHAVGEYELSLRFLEHALAINARCHGARSLKAAVSRHLLARTLSCVGDFRAALAHEKETYSIYKQRLGESHEKTRESSDCLRHLTHQAVVLQKRLNDATKSPPLHPPPPPLHIQPPSMGSVLDMLNVINGILFVQISPQDIEHFKAEIEKRQLKESSPEQSSVESKPKSSENTAAATTPSKKEPKDTLTAAKS